MKIEEIKCGDFLAKINLSRGANCIELVNSRYNASILRTPDYENFDNPYLYGMPILFPVNRIFGGCFEFERRKYEFPINEAKTNCTLHGFIHESEFTLKYKSESKLICLYKATAEKPYLSFPHEFEIEMEYLLTEKSIKQKTTVRNLSNTNMPIFIGFHTTFNTPFIKESTIDAIRIYAQLSEEFERNEIYLPTGKILPADAITENFNNGNYIPNTKISRHYRMNQSGIMTIEDITKKIKIIYKNDPKLSFRLIYGEGSGFICLEPQTCMANAQNSPFDRDYAGFEYIKPKKETTYISEIILESL